MVEITAGLHEGELVVLDPPSSGTNVDSFRSSAENKTSESPDSRTVASAQH